jgi:putative DNA methylase
VAKCTPEVKEEALNLARALIELSKSGLLDEDDVDVKLSRLVLGMEWWQ